MKQFLLTLFAVSLGGFLALLAYDRLIVVPREARASAQNDARIREQSPRVDLTQARADAGEVAVEVEGSVQRSVEVARRAMDAQAEEMDRRALVADAASRATMFRVSLTEYYQNNGRWPKDADEAGLPSPMETEGGAVRAIAIDGRGAVTVTLDGRFRPQSAIVLTPRANASGGVDWACVVEGDPLLRRVLTRCESR